MKALVIDESNTNGTYRGATRLKHVRDYSQGSMTDAVYRCESVEELTRLKEQIIEIDQSSYLSRKTQKKIERAMNLRHEELKNRLIALSKRGILVPNHMAKGQVLVGPDGKEIR